MLKTAYQNIVQPKLTIGKPNDQYEQEADQVADQVMKMPSSQITPIQRKCKACEEEELQMKPLSQSISPIIQMQNEEEEEELLQPKNFSSKTSTPSNLSSDLQGSKGSGKPLDSATQSFMSRSFGSDFSNVKVHTDSNAIQMNQQLNSKAFTNGSDIYFNSGQYNPRSSEGKQLLVHELTHVVQQNATNRSSVNSTSTIQRSIKVISPNSVSPNNAPKKNAPLVQEWLKKLSPKGSWTVNNSTGLVSSSERSTFCGTKKTKGKDHFSASSTPTGSKCICDLTATGSRDVEIHVANSFTVDGSLKDVNNSGEGLAQKVTTGGTKYHVGISGKDPKSIKGAGDSSPHSGTGKNQVLRDPPWIILGHEMCGHVPNYESESPVGHLMTPEGNKEALDIENKIRREQSTIANNYGVRKGEFKDAAGNFHFGAVYKVSSGETLSSISKKVGIPTSQMLSKIFRSNGDAITNATKNKIGKNEKLLIDNMFWHDVIKGETLSSISTMWGIKLSSLKRSNQSVKDPKKLKIGTRLLIPVS